MNEFEIKTAKRNFKELGLINIYPISEDYNMREFGSQEVDVVIEYTHKDVIYYTHCLFKNSEMKNNKLRTLQEKLLMHKENVDELIEKGFPYGANTMSNFVDSQLELILATKGTKKYSADFTEIDEVWLKIREGVEKSESPKEIFTEAMKIAKKEARINE